MIGRVYPAPPETRPCVPGFFPTDFVIERFIELGIEWFRNTPDAAYLVYGNLLDATIKDKYGKEKVEEIVKYIKETEIDVIQAFPAEDEETPCISINLQSSEEMIERTGLGDFVGFEDNIDALGNIAERTELGYIPMRDNILIGIHATGSPDKVKYLYYLIAYLIGAFKGQLENRVDKTNSLFNITFRATDLSKVNEYLPSSIFSRFMTITAENIAVVRKDGLPMIDNLIVDVKVGV